MIYIITGHLGAGKTLLAVSMAIERYLRQGKRVASNMTLNLDASMPAASRATAVKLPFIPKQEHLDALGKGYDDSQGYDESKFGLVLLDEAGSWLNSRDWSDKDRRGLFTWLTHARKYGWDVALIVQDFEALDAQVRRSICETFVKCSRLDRVKVPVLGISLPRIHVATAYYGGPTGIKSDRWYTRGTDVFKWYATTEAVKPEVIWTDEGPVDVRAVSTMLSAWHLRGRYLAPRLSRQLRLFCGLTALVQLVGVLVAFGLAGRSSASPLLLAAARAFKAAFTGQPAPQLGSVAR